MGDRRAPVQGDGPRNLLASHPHRARWVQENGREPVPPGTISWEEHVEAWEAYAKRFGRSQSAECMAQRGGFGYLELIDLLGHEPTTWERRHG